MTWWGLLCGGAFNCATASPATTTTGQYLKLLNPKQIDLMYQHSVFIEKAGWAAPSDGRGYIVNSTPYYIDQRWLLTYAGSALATGINAATTSIPVADLSRFAVGDNVLVGGVGAQSPEVMKVSALSGNSGAGTLTVSRGQFDENGRFPAIPHDAGDFVRTIVHAFGLQDFFALNMSSLCPATDINPSFGIQTWNQFQASFWQAKIAGDSRYANLDGLFLDNFVSAPIQILDNYAQVDYANANSPTDIATGNTYFADGMTDTASQVRAKLAGKIVMANIGGSATSNGPYLNGGMIEGVDQNWANSFVGDVTAFYTAWQTNGASLPIFILDASTATNSATTVQTNYQAVRFDLAQTLMNDGYFDYDEFLLGNSGAGLNAGGHQSSWWYDEYDAGGQGVGYLGTPLGAATQPVAGVNRRDFQHGVALSNTSVTPQTISLGRTFRKLSASGHCPDGSTTCSLPQTAQATGNDGILVTSITIQPNDGVILLSQ